MATTSTINHQDIHHQPVGVGVTLHQLAQQMTNCTSSVDSDSAKGSSCSDATVEDLIYFHTQSNPIMDFLYEGGDGGSSRESLANLYDEGLGTSLDGTEELTHHTHHPSLGRNDSGVFSSEESVAGISGNRRRGLLSSSTSTTSLLSSTRTMLPLTLTTTSNTPTSSSTQQKKSNNRPKNSSPNRQGPQRCAICGKTFSNASALTKHKLTHSDERKHHCTVCNKAFKRQDHLNGHMLTHRSKKPFECSANACGKSYCDARSLRRHIESRHGAEALATMTIAPTPHSESDFIIIPTPNHNTKSGSNPKSSKSRKRKNSNNSTKKSPKNSSATSSSATNSNSNPLLCHGSNSSAEENAVEENELLTSVENLLSLEDSSNSEETAAALLEVSLMEMGVIQGEIDEEIDMDMDIASLNVNLADTLNNNSGLKRSVDMQCCSAETSLLGESTGGNLTKKSQLHKLLTQRALQQEKCGSVEESERDTTAADVAAVTLIKESLIASCAAANNLSSSTPQFQLQLHPGQGWSSGNGLEGGSSERAKSVRSVESYGVLNKCPPSPPLTTPSLKEQLELIHQIIQQTTEESVIYTSGANLRTGLASPAFINSNKSSLKKAICVTQSKNSCKNNNEEKVDTSSGDDLNLNVGAVSGGREDKPAECAICCRRFKNTPALNGHMRLHGGYFKKESGDGKKKEPTTKETHGTPLQTASVSVRALIEEKIIQRRNNSNASSTTTTPKTSPQSSAPTTPTKTAKNLSPTTMVSGNSNQFLQNDGLASKNAFPNQTYSFDLLNEEEVFNQVSSICPDSFFSGIDETLLGESGIGTGSDSSQISTEFFNWSSSTNNNSNGVHSLFSGPGTPTTATSTCSDNPFTPLPTIDPVFFTPTPGSAHSYQSQGDDLADSPSFIYPTPPASLESHNALQSPLFPFPFPFEASPQSANHNLLTNNAQYAMIPSTSKSPSINSSTGCLSSTAIFLPTTSSSISSIGTTNYVNTFLLTTASPQIKGTNQFTSLLDPVMFSNDCATDDNSTDALLMLHQSKGSPVDIKPLLLPPPPSPSITPSSNLLTIPFSLRVGNQALSQMKGNEPCPIMGDSEDSFLSPSRITLSLNSSGSNPLSPKVAKRKALRNTLASNLRPQTTQSSPHFTPYPILSPVRSAPGLYWTFSPKLSHVDEIKKDRPRINIGANFQAIIPPLEDKKGKKKKAFYLLESYEDEFWTSETMHNSFPEDIDKYLEFACCSAIPGGGRNKEYALHILHLCKGDINTSMLLLMNPNPKLPPHLAQFKYPESEKWSCGEIQKFQDSLLRHGKDFREVSKDLGTKSVDSCVSFYQWWKKVCEKEYERIRGVWKKREAAFTIELLKTIPAQLLQTKTHLTTGQTINKPVKQTKPPANNRVLGANEEFPCKICGKVFSKVKSRSAHMKSHRPPPTPPSTSPAPVLSPASAATLMENKEKIADALQKHIFGKANAKSLQSNSITPAASPTTITTQSVAPFMPKIVKVEAFQQSQASTGIKTFSPPPTISKSPSQCFQPTTPTAHPLQLQAT